MKLPEFFGLDIGNHSLKLAQVKYTSNDTAKLEKIAKLQISSGLLGADDLAPLASSIKQIRESAGVTTKKVVIALPESAIVSPLIVLPDVEEKKLEQSIYFEAKQYLPLPIEEVQVDWIPLGKLERDGQKLIQLLLVAAPKKLIQKYLDLLKLAGLEVLAVETESVATARACTYNQNFEQGALILDFGGTNTDISVIKNKSVIFSQSIGTGSDVLTKAIASEFSLDETQAEQYKRNYGLLQDQADGKIFNAVQPVMKIIINEIIKTLNYFREHFRENTPNQLLIVGDGANLPGLPEYLTKNLSIQANVLDPVSSLQMDPTIKNEVTQMPTVGFSVAVGLALKKE